LVELIYALANFVGVVPPESTVTRFVAVSLLEIVIFVIYARSPCTTGGPADGTASTYAALPITTNSAKEMGPGAPFVNDAYPTNGVPVDVLIMKSTSWAGLGRK
jgi:hypothetical protein